MRFLRLFTAVSFIFAALLPMAGQANPAPVLIGLDADMSSGAAQGGEAIRRGALLAIKEINDKGGVLGRPLQLVVRDHRGNPARGIDNIQEFSGMQDLAAVMSGIHTPVVLRELPLIHEKKIVFLVPWAAGTSIIDNGFEPNYIFRVSVRDEFAGGFLVDHALKKGSKKLGLLLEKTGWGRSNQAAIESALAERDMAPAAIQWFGWGARDLSKQIEAIRNAGADQIILVANAREGSVLVKNMAALPKSQQLPILSHWGITGGSFFKKNEKALAGLDLSFLQTFSFHQPPVPERGGHLLELYKAMFPDTKGPADIRSPVGVAHAYDLVHLLAAAIKQAGSIDRVKVRAALENLPAQAGVMRDYSPAFTAGRHDALDKSSFIIAHYGADGAIYPVDTGSQ